MTQLPLLGHTEPDQIVAWQQGQAITVNHFLSDVTALARQLPPGQHLLNMCGDRYRFAVGLAAAVVCGKVSLLPSTQTPETIRQMQAFAPDVFCLHDALACHLALPRFCFPELPDAPESKHAIPMIDREQLIAVVFTSGSTGTPVPHQKYWGALVQSVLAEAERIGLTAGTVPHAVVGTVPPQHMYGFESTVLIALLSGHALSGAHPFYPADIVTALQEVPPPRLLVSTPVHLRMLLEADLTVPDVALLLSATAPLSLPLAHALEARFEAPLQEIYGCTETGTLATRRSTQTPQWRLFADVELSLVDDIVTAFGGHVLRPTVLHDVIELMPGGCFLLHGRTSEMINIAGKRSSLAHLNHVLNTIDGVLDGAFYMPDAACGDKVMRLAACVVAPSLSATQIVTALRTHIDPVFLPRPLLFVTTLPRNSTGKLPQEALKKLFQMPQGVCP